MARVKEAARKTLHDKNASSSASQSPKRSPSPPSPPSPINHSGNKSSSETSFKSLSDHENDFVVDSSLPA